MLRWLQDVFDVPLVIQLTGKVYAFIILLIVIFNCGCIRRRKVSLQT